MVNLKPANVWVASSGDGDWLNQCSGYTVEYRQLAQQMSQQCRDKNQNCRVKQHPWISPCVCVCVYKQNADSTLHLCHDKCLEWPHHWIGRRHSSNTGTRHACILSYWTRYNHLVTSMKRCDDDIRGYINEITTTVQPVKLKWSGLSLHAVKVIKSWNRLGSINFTMLISVHDFIVTTVSVIVLVCLFRHPFVLHRMWIKAGVNCELFEVC